MKIVIAPDSFKHTLSAGQVCGIAAEAINEALPGAEVVSLPIADGGEGTADNLIAALNGKKVFHTVTGPEFETIKAYYGLVGETAVIELASVCGLEMVKTPDPEQTTTCGVGEMIKNALDDGCKKLILCIGGSATNDGGMGALAALGVSFRDGAGRELAPKGKSLSEIASIDTKKIDQRLLNREILIACDVNNPLYGEKGAAFIFAPQKGADENMVLRLDAGLRNYSRKIKEAVKKDVSKIPGSGAAGGFPAGFLAFCRRAELKAGIEIVLDAVDFNRHAEGADLIITGEGKTDGQTLGGKAVLGVARRAKSLNIPVIVVSGAVEDGVDEMLYKEGVRAIFSCARQTKPFDEMKSDCGKWLGYTVKNVIKAIQL